jgi:hypothetical protein
MTKCKKCGKSIEFVLTSKGHRMPVNAETYTPGDTHYIPGVHISHFADCPDAEIFRKPIK